MANAQRRVVTHFRKKERKREKKRKDKKKITQRRQSDRGKERGDLCAWYPSLLSRPLTSEREREREREGERYSKSLKIL